MFRIETSTMAKLELPLEIEQAQITSEVIETTLLLQEFRLAEIRESLEVERWYSQRIREAADPTIKTAMDLCERSKLLIATAKRVREDRKAHQRS
jgi:hypothetical protein